MGPWKKFESTVVRLKRSYEKPVKLKKKCSLEYEKGILNSDGQQFHKYQFNEQQSLTSNH
jgi:hypothetical protein